MSEKKDYLSELAKEVDASKKIASFQEEKVERIEKPRLEVKPAMIIIPVVILAVLGVLSYFMFFAPKIVVPNFVGQTKSDVSAWVKQQEIDPQGLVMKEEYSFDYEEGKIINQTVEAGKKVKKDAIITFTVSLGADPSEKIPFLENVLSLNKQDINDWISKNKLQKVKINTAYSDTVEEGNVISYDLKGIDASDFTRGTNVSFTVSKGPQPAGTVNVTVDYTGEVYETFETWAKQNKLNIEKTEAFDDKIEAGKIIYISIKKDSTIKQGETVSVKVSKGKAVTMIDLTKLNKEKATDWCATNGIKCYFKEKFNNDKYAGEIISQSVKKGTIVDGKSMVDVVVSKWMPDLFGFNGKTLGELKDWIVTQNREGEAYLNINPEVECSGGSNYDDSSEIIGWINPERRTYIPTGSTIKVKVACAANPTPAPEVKVVTLTQDDVKDAETMDKWCSVNNISCTYKYEGVLEADSIVKVSVINAVSTYELVTDGIIKKSEVQSDTKLNILIKYIKPETTTSSETTTADSTETSKN